MYYLTRENRNKSTASLMGLHFLRKYIHRLLVAYLKNGERSFADEREKRKNKHRSHHLQLCI